MKIVLTGGGTGGHVVPNISLLPILKKHFSEICYIGSNGIEKKIVTESSNIKFYEIGAVKRDNAHKIKNLLLPFKLLKVVREAGKILDEIRPDVVFSKGGYVSLPVCVAAAFRKIPIISHESDLSLGRANKIIYTLSSSFCTTFERTTEGLKKAVFTGAPIRESLRHGDKKRGREITRLSRDLPFIMFVGGSTGASFLNEIVYQNLDALTSRYNIIHVTGKGKGRKIVHANYYQVEYASNIEDLYAISDVVVSRAGSGVIYELLSLNKKMILVPLPKSTSSRGDQVENARYFKEKYNTSVIFQDEMSITRLLNEIEDSIAKALPVVLGEESQNLFMGSQNIVNVILSVVSKKKK